MHEKEFNSPETSDDFLMEELEGFSGVESDAKMNQFNGGGMVKEDPTPYYAAIAEIINQKQILYWLVVNSKPSEGSTAYNDEEGYKTVAKWRENILKNYNELSKLADDEVFDFESGKGRHESLIEQYELMRQLELEISKKQEKSARITNRKTKPRTERKNDNKTEEANKTIRDKGINEKYDKKISEGGVGSQSDEMLGRQPRSNYYEYGANTREIQLLQDDVESAEQEILNKKTKFGRGLRKFGQFFAQIGKNFMYEPKEFGKVVDPKKHFVLDTTHIFRFLPITLNEITPLIAPRAKDSMIDAETPIQGDLYKNLKNVDKHIPENINPNDDYVKTVTQARATQFDANVPNMNIPSNDELKRANQSWEKSQQKLADEDLEKKYKGLYNLYPTEFEWKEKKDVEVRNDESLYVNGRATEKTVTEFKAWLKAHPDPDIIWKGDKFELSDSKKSDETWKNRLLDFNGYMTQLDGWQIDEIKIFILKEMSKRMINEQKWMIQDLDRSNELDTAGEAKSSATDVEQNKQIGKEGDDKNALTMTGFVQAGVYNQEEQKRHYSYGSKLFEEPKDKYIPDPQDPKALRNQTEKDEDNFPFQNAKKDVEKVDELINWKIDYKVEVLKKPT